MESSDTHKRMADAFLLVSDELRRESDRGSVILAFAWMDEQLTQNLHSYCLPSRETNLKADELFGPNRPLGTASAKIDLSYRLGLLRQGTHKSLHLFRKLRNDFAHLSDRLTFDSPDVRPRILSIFDNEEVVLNAIWETVLHEPVVLEAAKSTKGKQGSHILREVLGTRALFCMTAAVVVAGLVLVGKQLQPVLPLVEVDDA